MATTNQPRVASPSAIAPFRLPSASAAIVALWFSPKHSPSQLARDLLTDTGIRTGDDRSEIGHEPQGLPSRRLRPACSLSSRPLRSMVAGRSVLLAADALHI